MNAAVRHYQLENQILSDGFDTYGFRVNDRKGFSAVLNIDLFNMSWPTFPPHPHAGFSAVTYMLPDSEGGFTNRDSFGAYSIIGPGALHWTQAGRGMIHEEVPEKPGVWGGPFYMAGQDDLTDAKRRYAAGEMGRLEPSF